MLFTHTLQKELLHDEDEIEACDVQLCYWGKCVLLFYLLCGVLTTSYAIELCLEMFYEEEGNTFEDSVFMI